MQWMKTTLTKIIETKKSTKNQLAELKNNYLVTIYDGLSRQKNVREIHKKLYEMTINQKKLGLATSENMLKVALKATNSLKKKIGSPTFVAGYVKTTYGKEVEGSAGLDLLSVFVFDILIKNNIEKKLSHEINKQADKVEGETKEQAINDILSQNRQLNVPRVFYLASQHKDSATDHAPYQGKMYIDELWQSAIQDEDLKRDIGTYVNQHNVQTVQWVMGKPVWFITRPNCRHYFMEMNTEEVLGKSKTRLLKKYKMTTAIGNREYLQTIKHATNKEWYDDIRNAQLLLEKYKERLKLHEMMYQKKANLIIKKAIKKDKMLINKWENYINEKEKK